MDKTPLDETPAPDTACGALLDPPAPEESDEVAPFAIGLGT